MNNAHHARRWSWRDTIARELRHAARALRRTPTFTIAAVATLGVALGAATTIFAVVDAVLVRPLAYPAADRLVVIEEVVPRLAELGSRTAANALHFDEWRLRARSFDGLALVGGTSVNLTGDGEPERVAAARVSPALFQILGVRPRIGRLLRADEDAPGRDRVVVLSDSLWRRRFGADPSVVGHRIVIDGQPYEVVGILPETFAFPALNQFTSMTVADDAPQLWKPFALAPAERSPFGDFNYVAIGRLRPGVAAAAARAELDVIQRGFSRRALGGAVELRTAVTPMQERLTGQSQGALRLLAAAVGAVLLVACVNIANLLFARAFARQREFLVRSAIGASRAWLVWHVLAESLLLVGGAAAVGLAIASEAISAIAALAPLDLPRAAEIHLDMRVVLFVTVASLTVGILVGMLPAWRVARVPLIAIGGTSAPSSKSTFRSLLVATEIAVSAVCLVATGLLVHSLVAVLSVDKGFDAERLLVADLRLPQTRYPDTAATMRLDDALLAELTAVRGVSRAGISNMLPLGGEGANNAVFVEQARDAGDAPPIADVRIVNPGYFATLRIPLVTGTLFPPDRERRVAVVSAMAAARLWPGDNAIGKRFRIGTSDSPLAEVVGVVGDVHGSSLEKAPTLTVYMPYWQRERGNRRRLSVAVRVDADPRAVATALTRAIHRVDPTLGVPPSRPMDDVVDASVAMRRFQTNLVVLFGVGALVLAAIGIYGMASYAVAQRTKEIGNRIALGAEQRRVLRLIVGDALRVALVGLGVGVPVAIVAAMELRSLLFGVAPADFATFAIVCGLIAATTLAAAAIPARRAARVDPLLALRAE
jgi:predicted permease